MLHNPLESTISLQDLQLASEQDPVFAQLRTFICTGVREELSCWGDVCIARGPRTVVPSCLQACILVMAHKGHLGILRVKQRCRDLVWWPGIDIEVMVRDCTACFVSGKTGPPTPPPLQPLNWPDKPWTHLQLDICESHTTNNVLWWSTISIQSGQRSPPSALSPPL